MDTKKFYGPVHVDNIVENGDYSTIKTVDGKEHIVATSEVPMLVVDLPVDYTELRKQRCASLVSTILMAMKKFNIRQDEVEFTLGWVAKSVNENMEVGSNKLWGVENFGEQTFLDVDKVLKA